MSEVVILVRLGQLLRKYQFGHRNPTIQEFNRLPLSKIFGRLCIITFKNDIQDILRNLTDIWNIIPANQLKSLNINVIHLHLTVTPLSPHLGSVTLFGIQNVRPIYLLQL